MRSVLQHLRMSNRMTHGRQTRRKRCASGPKIGVFKKQRVRQVRGSPCRPWQPVWGAGRGHASPDSRRWSNKNIRPIHESGTTPSPPSTEQRLVADSLRRAVLYFVALKHTLFSETHVSRTQTISTCLCCPTTTYCCCPWRLNTHPDRAELQQNVHTPYKRSNLFPPKRGYNVSRGVPQTLQVFFESTMSANLVTLSACTRRLVRVSGHAARADSSRTTSSTVFGWSMPH